jgi:hypothetical protein
VNVLNRAEARIAAGAPAMLTSKVGAPRQLTLDGGRDQASGCRGRLLIVVAKGLGRLETLYQELEILGWQTRKVEIDDRLIRYVSRAAGLRPTAGWHRRAYLRQCGRLARTPLAFAYRSRLSRRVLARLSGQVDCALQVGAMWSPGSASAPSVQRATTRGAP